MYLRLLELIRKQALMIKISIICNNRNWTKLVKNPNKLIQKQINNFNKKFKKYKKKNIFCTILLSGNSEIKKLNKKFRKKNKATDVLSFPYYSKRELTNRLKKENEIYLGDIIVNFNMVKNKKNKASFKSEFNKLWIHGLTHLFGYDHKKDKDFYKMNRVEKKFISYIND